MIVNEPSPGGTPDEEAGLYEEAGELHRRGRPDEALLLLQRLLQRSPDDVAARFALAVCLTDLGRAPEAQANLRRVLDSEPRHHLAAYRLGRILQAEGASGEAAEAYRRVLTVTDYQDTRARLRECEAAVAGPQPLLPPAGPGGGAPPLVGPTLTPGPPTLRARVDSHRVADRGHIVRSVRLKARHLLPTLLRHLLIAVALAVLLFVAGESLRIPMGVRMLGMLALLAVVALILAFPLVAYVKTRTNGADFYEYGVDVKAGFVRRRVQFVWYYQIVESPSYVRTFGTYLTNTASLGLRYNEAGASSTEYVELPGIGTPDDVREIGRYVESRIFPERHVIRGPWT
jgi:hypothetical protein